MDDIYRRRSSIFGVSRLWSGFEFVCVYSTDFAMVQMKKLLAIIIVVLFVGCASVPHSADVLVRYPMEGKIVWMSEDGSMKRSPYFVIDHADFLEFLKLEREIEREKQE